MDQYHYDGMMNDIYVMNTIAYYEHREDPVSELNSEIDQMKKRQKHLNDVYDSGVLNKFSHKTNIRAMNDITAITSQIKFHEHIKNTLV